MPQSGARLFRTSGLTGRHSLAPSAAPQAMPVSKHVYARQAGAMRTVPSAVRRPQSPFSVNIRLPSRQSRAAARGASDYPVGKATSVPVSSIAWRRSPFVTV